MTNLLPSEFADLEPYLVWAQSTELARHQVRVSRSIEEIRAFYDAVLPRIEAILEYLNAFPLDDMPEQEHRLLELSLGLVEAANAVEMFEEPGMRYGFPIERFTPKHHKTVQARGD